jgi:hypothetical protein
MLGIPLIEDDPSPHEEPGDHQDHHSEGRYAPENGERENAKQQRADYSTHSSPLLRRRYGLRQ